MYYVMNIIKHIPHGRLQHYAITVLIIIIVMNYELNVNMQAGTSNKHCFYWSIWVDLCVCCLILTSEELSSDLHMYQPS